MEGSEPEKEGVEGLAPLFDQLVKYLLPVVHVLIRKDGM
jgi:hypothetical protein